MVLVSRVYPLEPCKILLATVLEKRFSSCFRAKKMRQFGHAFSRYNGFWCKNSSEEVKGMEDYREAFSRRMEMAGIKPHHRIAMGVSGGPDSMALCILTSEWKSNALDGKDIRSGNLKSLLGIVVDHGLRAESEAEAKYVKGLVSNMGIQCEIACCDWSDGRPEQGHLQKAARDMRYKIFQDLCTENQIDVLLVAHHADDQAELFILRLSRNSGVLGLAGMAFVSQLFPESLHNYGENSAGDGVLLVRPLLQFSKDDLYKICQEARQPWVEDPTNRSQLFVRNRIRISLRHLSRSVFKAELDAVISACRKTRSFVDHYCNILIKQTVTIVNYGYAKIDLEKLNASNVEDLCLSKFITIVLQFISQRHRPVRGSVSAALLKYIRGFPCKSAFTAAACYLCPAPSSKGKKILVCFSHGSPQPSSPRVSSRYLYHHREQRHSSSNEIEHIIASAKLYSDQFVPDASNVPFLHATSSECVLNEARKQGLLSHSTHLSILSLQREESKQFLDKKGANLLPKGRQETEPMNVFNSEPLQCGHLYHFMNRFWVTWNHQRGKISDDTFHFDEAKDFNLNIEQDRWNCCLSSCVVEDTTVLIRHMEDADWMLLADLAISRSSLEQNSHGVLTQTTDVTSRVVSDTTTMRADSCSDYVRWSAKKALQLLKCIPVSARRGLPVLTDKHGLLLSVPSVCFKRCPYMSALVTFKPKVPLGGGYSSYI
ncbi:hypothetical protein AMTRI_Chr05g66430 [Amborella trichopoda]